jgi:hypothetical protein
MLKKSCWILGLVFLFIFSGSFISEAVEINGYEYDQLDDFDEALVGATLSTQCNVSTTCQGSDVAQVSQDTMY